MVIRKFGFTESDKKKPIKEFSGGQRTKIAFVKLLLEKPDILLLDEPTNHLDIETVEWLEGYLKDYPRAVVIVSHDRMFIDNICDVVYEIEYGKIKRYSGNYTKFMELKREAYRKQLKDYTAQQAEIKRLFRFYHEGFAIDFLRAWRQLVNTRNRRRIRNKGIFRYRNNDIERARRRTIPGIGTVPRVSTPRGTGSVCQRIVVRGKSR